MSEALGRIICSALNAALHETACIKCNAVSAVLRGSSGFAEGECDDMTTAVN